MSEEINYCPECNLYWYLVGENNVEFRLFMFVPINLKKCKFCRDSSIPIPKELIEFRKKAEGK